MFIEHMTVGNIGLGEIQILEGCKLSARMSILLLLQENCPITTDSRLTEGGHSPPTAPSPTLLCLLLELKNRAGAGHSGRHVMSSSRALSASVHKYICKVPPFQLTLSPSPGF